MYDINKDDHCTHLSVADPGGEEAIPHPVRISHKKDGHTDFMFLSPTYPAAGSATVFNQVELLHATVKCFLFQTVDFVEL